MTCNPRPATCDLQIRPAEMALTKRGEIQGILFGITEKVTWRASLEASEDIWMVSMAIVKDFHVKMRLASFCCVNFIIYSVRAFPSSVNLIFHS